MVFKLGIIYSNYTTCEVQISGLKGAGSREQGAGSREQGAGKREQGAGSREQGAGKREEVKNNVYLMSSINAILADS
ncbi:hypothetical protein BJP34_18830 [Moorena producens PAL-8-15-08-1]|uniref:Uncharacterized protein n=1 Tax=Moorena producens PAL-8-15-08-1 TaxID=1458985 RepID=A0A1D8TU81_9CYAN|nr:hypothetical protein BJP34_18830 [Moorena producens PAL-8-15-08-1]